MLDTYRVHHEDEGLDIHRHEDREFLTKNYPAVMATKPSGVSSDYQFMSTSRISELLQDRFNLRIAAVHQQSSRMRDPMAQEHFVRYRLPSNQYNLKEVGDSLPELVLTNSHNGRSRIRVRGGIYRLVCDNGMVVSDQSFGAINMRHFGEANSFEIFEKLLSEVAENFNSLDVRLHGMKNQLLTKAQQTHLARELLAVRKGPNWIEPHHVLEARRVEDATEDFGKRDLWTTFNVLQENLTTSAADVVMEDGKVRKLPTIRSARPTVEVNRALWEGLDNYCTKFFPQFVPAVKEAVEVA